MATLYEILKEYDEVLNSFEVDEETGEVIMDFAKLEELSLAKEQKIENIGKYILNLSAEQTALTERKQALDKRIKSIANKVTSLTNYLETCLDGEPFKCVDFEVKFSKSERVEVTEDFYNNTFNERFYKVKTEPNKADIKKAIKDGYIVQGASLVECRNMKIK